MALIHTYPPGAHITELLMQWQNLLQESWQQVVIIRRSASPSRNTSVVWQRIQRDGASHLQHFLVLMQHRWDSVFRLLVVRTVCPEPSMTLMFRQHWYPSLWMLPSFRMWSHQSWKRLEINWYGFVHPRISTIYQTIQALWSSMRSFTMICRLEKWFPLMHLTVTVLRQQSARWHLEMQWAWRSSIIWIQETSLHQASAIWFWKFRLKRLVSFLSHIPWSVK